MKSLLPRAPTTAPALIAVAAGALLLLWAGGNAYNLSLLGLLATYSLVGLGMYAPLAWAGSMSLAFSAYAAIGAYSVAVISTKADAPVWVGWIVGAALAVVVALILGAATMRLTGFHLVAITLLFATAFQTWLVSANWLGSSNGIGQIAALSLGWWHPSTRAIVIGGLALVVLIAIGLDRLRRSSWGVIARALGQAPLAVECCGTRVPRITIVMQCFGAAIAAIGGSFFATDVQGITPVTFTTDLVFLVLFFLILGGTSSPWGALIGAAIAVELTVRATFFASGGGLLLLALAVLVVLLIAPSGILGLLGDARRRLAAPAGRRARLRGDVTR